ncbi:hypothetical protein [Sphingomonas endolithica]|uniref:hypothetical protein n=1 Tax=Sphingomonas endolithica TaxID=2972485 RepID=UPI0021AE69CC|nr:hypothetical protein [Sphingomonas sp. ZFBP2030]
MQSTVWLTILFGVLAAGYDGPRVAATVSGDEAGRSLARQSVVAGAAARGEGAAAKRLLATDHRWSANCPIPSDAPDAPLGQTFDTLKTHYGSPATTDRFVLGEATDAVRMSVRNVLLAPGDLKREVAEMIWRADGCELRVWLAERNGRWVAVRAMRAPEGGEH